MLHRYCGQPACERSLSCADNGNSSPAMAKANVITKRQRHAPKILRMRLGFGSLLVIWGCIPVFVIWNLSRGFSYV